MAFRRQCEQCSDTEKLFEALRNFQQKYIREIEEKRENDRVRPIRKAKEYIQNHYGEPITLEEVSSEVGPVSYTHLSLQMFIIPTILIG